LRPTATTTRTRAKHNTTAKTATKKTKQVKHQLIPATAKAKVHHTLPPDLRDAVIASNIFTANCTQRGKEEGGERGIVRRGKRR
jgi:hypothetical protein